MNEEEKNNIEKEELTLDLSKVESPKEMGPEKINSPEKKPEETHESSERNNEKTEDEGANGEEVKGIVAAGRQASSNEEREKQIEKILENGLENIYMKMPDDKKIEFKTEGEETAMKINELFNRGKARVKNIISLVMKWLSIIPGINKFFLEQEAKIKTDEIMKINNS